MCVELIKCPDESRRSLLGRDTFPPAAAGFAPTNQRLLQHHVLPQAKRGPSLPTRLWPVSLTPPHSLSINTKFPKAGKVLLSRDNRVCRKETGCHFAMTTVAAMLGKTGVVTDQVHDLTPPGCICLPAPRRKMGEPPIAQ